MDGGGGAERPVVAAHNGVSGVAGGVVVQAGSIAGGVVVTTAARRWWGSAGREASGVDEWTEGLAQGELTLRRREEAQRRVHDPVALPVRWHAAAAEVTDHWANIRRLPAGAVTGPLVVAGRIEQLGEVYRRVPSGRLVILGPAGAGKTVLAGRLALDLLAARQPGQPVPVIVSVGSWNPATTPLNTWLAERIGRDHPGLAVPAGQGGPSRSAAVIEAGRVLPILDGFDEIDPWLHRAALRGLNADPDVPVVITSRVVEYTAAVRDVAVLTAAAVVELDDLTLEDLADYLPRTAAGHRTGTWDPVLRRLRAQPHATGPALVRQVLANPLMVFLARTTYGDNSANDPAELLDTHRFATAQVLQDHLLAAFIPAIYQSDRPGGARRWSADRAHRYLTYLAHHLHRAGTRDVAWWQLRDTIPRRDRTLVFAVLDGLVIGLGFGLVLALTVGVVFAYGLVPGVTTGLAHGLVFGLAATLASGLTVALTAFFTTSLHGRPGCPSRRLVTALGTGLVVGPATSLTLGLMLALAHTVVVDLVHVFAVNIEFVFTVGLAVGLPAGLASGLIGLRAAGPRPTRTRLQLRGRVRCLVGRFVIGFGFGGAVVLAVGYGFAPAVGFGLAAAVAFGLEAPVSAADVVSAAESLARDRRNTIRKVLAVGLPVGLGFGLAGTFAAGILAAVVVGFVSVRVTSAWIYWLVLVRGWLPLTDRLPWRVKDFLTDACLRGVLRQTGAVYQFRHARLQDHLTGGP
ncbi:NACHT domain-containing protein [Umezawaea endophytica]|uniref:NACHT domain-containing protein n=1 Tax=Umezawaea endophytica TaxID=1654476 RepID=A0A9X2VHR7_9PSEU|nr:NACHT domain-containing protein [Umezawaea endophytica]MCS7476871.1 NACHT domain-containing protein [Umezawaea endophytica]